MSDVQRLWDLWNLKALFPEWGDRERTSLLRTGAAQDTRQQELFGDPVAALQRFGPAAIRVLQDHPDLVSGLTISLHLGPYSLAPVPWLVAGHDVHVLVNRGSLAEIKPVYEALQQALSLPGQVIWVPIEGTGFALRLWRALRRGQAVFAFLDGNDGLDGCEGTLRQGIVHHLPGRDIRVRTGLARLALGLRCPVHSLFTVWDEKGDFSWQRGPTWRWPRNTEPAVATRELFDWGFGVIRRHPAQWRAWNMLTGVYESFRADATEPACQVDFAVPQAVLAAENRSLPLVWQREARIWPGDMIADVAGACFYAAEGLRGEEVADLAGRKHFSVAELVDWRGLAWVTRHLPRLVALGFVGRLVSQPGQTAAVVRNPG